MITPEQEKEAKQLEIREVTNEIINMVVRKRAEGMDYPPIAASFALAFRSMIQADKNFNVIPELIVSQLDLIKR